MGELTTKSSQDAHEDALTGIFTSGARVAVLRAFLLDPTREYYQRQVEVATGLPIRAIQRELDRLTRAGLFYRRAEGNRTYYRVDVDYPLFPELRSMVLKTSSFLEVLRGLVAIEKSVRLAFMNESEHRVLVVVSDGHRMDLPMPEPFRLKVMIMEDFMKALVNDPPSLEPFLAKGVDLLGRREDIIWRHIEAAGYLVERGRGVA